MGGIKIGYLPQEPELDPEKTVREEVESGLGEVAAAQKRLEEVYAEYANPDADFDALAEEQGRLEAIIAAGSSTGGGAEHELEIAADALRLPEWDAKIGNLSGGEKRRVALCKLLLSKPDMLLLDEPTNHLDAESVEWLEQFLVRFPGTVVAVTHDRYFLDNAAEWIFGTRPRTRYSVERQLLVLAGAERKTLGKRGEIRSRARESDEAGIGMGATKCQRPPSQV